MKSAILMSIHVFPHSYWPESIIKKIISFFGPVKVYLPWMMESPKIFRDKPIKILRPPSYMKPGNFFMAMLAEYRNWANLNHDKNYLELIKLGPDGKLTDNKTWEIRQMLGHTIESLPSKEEETIKWHLLLHMARDIEENSFDADKILKALKDKKAPLEGSIENNVNIKDLWEDLHDLGTQSMLNEPNLRRIFEAWFGLFGGYLNKNDSLITYNRQVMDYLAERWDTMYPANISSVSPVIVFNVPDLSNHDFEVQDQDQTKNDIEKILKEIKDLITSIGKIPAHNLADLDKLSKKLDESIKWIIPNRALRCTLRYLYPIQDTVLAENDKILRWFFNQTIILVEE